MIDPKLIEKIPNAIKAVFRFDGKEYVTFHDQYVFDQPEDYEGQWRYIWEEGNYSCDCNKSLFIQRQCMDASERVKARIEKDLSGSGE